MSCQKFFLKGLIVALNNQEVFCAQNHPDNCSEISSKTLKNAQKVSQVGSGSGGKGLKVAKSAALATRRKVASPQNKTRLPEINKLQARIYEVEISMCYPVDSNTCIKVITLVRDSCFRLLPEGHMVDGIG
jgi:hypothetical protein